MVMKRRSDATGCRLVGLELEAVDLVVEVDHLLGELAVALDQGPDARLDHLLDLGPHEQHTLAQLRELGLVFAVGVTLHQPNRPVM
jgi:hypothetical protein